MKVCEACGYIECDAGEEEPFCCDCKPEIKINLDEVIRRIDEKR